MEPSQGTSHSCALAASPSNGVETPSWHPIPQHGTQNKSCVLCWPLGEAGFSNATQHICKESKQLGWKHEQYGLEDGVTEVWGLLLYLFCSMWILTLTGANIFPNVLIIDTLQGNTSIPNVHYPNAFIMYSCVKIKLWNTAFHLNLRHGNPHSLSSNNMKGSCSVASIF